MVFDVRRPYRLTIVDVAGAVEEPSGLNIPDPEPRTIEPYRGLGAWIDGYDFAEADHGKVADIVADMADHGVTTIFLQSGRIREDSPGELEDRWLITDWLANAHANNIDVVAWVLPKFRGDSKDLDYLMAAADFRALGESFDGVGVDIEWVDDEDTTDDERNERLIKLSKDLDEKMGDDAIGAIVLPPPFLNEVSPKYWPEFPWTDIADHYDVWLPMAYWSNRSNDSGYGDGYNFALTSIRDIRDEINDPAAPVHAIGGIGGSAAEDRLDGPEPIAGIDDLYLFGDALVAGDAIGGSIYDWYSQDETARDTMDEIFSIGIASSLARTQQAPQ